MITTKSGTPLASDYVRVVQGGRGDYVEFTRDQLNWDHLVIPEDQQWREDDPSWKDKVYYVEWRSTDATHAKIYHQKRLVNYADYKVGLFYIAPADLDLTSKAAAPIGLEPEPPAMCVVCQCDVQLTSTRCAVCFTQDQVGPITAQDIVDKIHDCRRLLESEITSFSDSPGFSVAGHQGGIASYNYLEQWIRKVIKDSTL